MKKPLLAQSQQKDLSDTALMIQASITAIQCKTGVNGSTNSHVLLGHTVH